VAMGAVARLVKYMTNAYLLQINVQCFSFGIRGRRSAHALQIRVQMNKVRVQKVQEFAIQILQRCFSFVRKVLIDGSLKSLTDYQPQLLKKNKESPGLGKTKISANPIT
jgi:hypothetical protein